MSFATHSPVQNGACRDLIRQMESLRLEIEQQAAESEEVLAELPPMRRASAENLLHYLALRSKDLRALQDRLTRLGLSSLGRLEPNVLATIKLVLSNLYLLNGQKPPETEAGDTQSGFNLNADLLEHNTEKLLGPHPEDRRVHIMVTMAREAANDYMMVHQLLKSGMNCMRINCSRDDESTWLKMIDHLADAKRATGRNCRVLMDLGGPKLRTGPMESTAAVIKIRPRRANDGHILRPARIWLTTADTGLPKMEAADANLVVERDWLATASTGDKLRLQDARQARRVWRINGVSASGCWAEADKTSYVTNGTELRLIGARGIRKTTISGLPEKESAIHISRGDCLLMSMSDKPGIPAHHDSTGNLLQPGCVSLPISEVYRDVRRGESVFFDDGRIAGIVEKVERESLQIRIIHTHKPVEMLSGDRGINLPDTLLKLPALSDKSLKDLDFAARHADLIGLSFTNCAEDVRTLRERLHEMGCDDKGVVFKIETRRGFANLPEIILEALKSPACGVMIARGDLAVECGFERMAELQEEIMWICESAHVPVIWATQVLENLTRRGFASRAEITDAAMGQSAEAVMLNKGPHITEAVCTLDNILRRMQGHHNKKRSMMRKLELASNFSGKKR